jgi:hypothetical protein
MPLGQASGFPRTDPGGRVNPRFWHRLIRFRHFIDGSLALASLNLACRNLVPAFPQRSPPRLLSAAACGGLRPEPDCRPRRGPLHLSYSYAPPFGPAMLVTHDPKRSSALKICCDAQHSPQCNVVASGRKCPVRPPWGQNATTRFHCAPWQRCCVADRGAGAVRRPDKAHRLDFIEGGGRALPGDADAEAMRAAAGEVLANPSYRLSAQRCAKALAGVDGAGNAANEVEALLTRTASTRSATADDRKGPDNRRQQVA